MGYDKKMGSSQNGFQVFKMAAIFKRAEKLVFRP
jgi:hypothetical protein